MTDAQIGIAALTVMLASSLGVGVYTVLARRRGWMAITSARSAHQRPTPVGAGLVFALVIVALLVAGVATGHLPALWLWLAGLTGLLSVVGWLDDRFRLSVILRLGIQAAVCLTWAVCLVQAGALPYTVLPVVTLVQLWFINLFNFMDGLDGLAGTEAVMVLLALLVLAGTGSAFGSVALLAAVAVAGFLVWNLPPARVFMGDAGSLCLGFLLSCLPWLDAERWLLPWLILVAAFVTDASLTLVWRYRRGDVLVRAHRLHVYQRLARNWGGHAPVLWLLLILNAVWLWPWAWLAWQWPGVALPCLLAAYAGVSGLWWYGHRKLPAGGICPDCGNAGQ